jgi:hypothetical protein
LARIVTCPCGHPLGVAAQDRWVLHHRHRAWTLLPGVELPDVFDTVDCDRCGAATPVADLDVHEYVADRAAARVA